MTTSKNSKTRNRVAGYWSESRKSLLRLTYPVATKKDLCNLFPEVSADTLKSYAHRLGLRKNKSRKVVSDVSWLLNGTNLSFYWLGFIMADGNFSDQGNIRFYISVKDDYKVRELAELCKSKVHYRMSKSTGNQFVGTTVYDSKVCKEIFRIFGLVKGKPKTYHPPNLSCLSTDESFLSFLAGFIDGNGCIGSYDVVRRGKKTKLNSLVLCNHESWKDTYQYINKRISELLNIKYLPSRVQICESKCRLTYRSVLFLRSLNSKVMSLNIPVMERKWVKLKNI